ncbi:MAG: DinB family protein [Tepidisphaeraceae bacterium]
MDIATLLAVWEFSRARLLGILETIEKSGQDVQQVLAWRPGPGRAHIGWQAMHCAATHDRYINERLKGVKVMDEARIANFAGGSTPSDTNVPSLADIRSALSSTYENAIAYLKTLTAVDLAAR